MNKRNSKIILLAIGFLFITMVSCGRTDKESVKETLKETVQTLETEPLSSEKEKTETTITEINETEVLTEDSSVTEAEELAEDDIRPEVKEGLDSYEEMMNEYCDFMEKYTESDNAMSMLGDYAEMMKVYAEAMDKIDQMNVDEFTNAEMEYYIDVNSRVEKRLLEVSPK